MKIIFNALKKIQISVFQILKTKAYLLKKEIKLKSTIVRNPEVLHLREEGATKRPHSYTTHVISLSSSVACGCVRPHKRVVQNKG